MPTDSSSKNSRSSRSSRLSVLCVLGALSLVGCTNSLPKYHSLGNGFRVLAIQADNPERALGQAVNLTVYLTDLASQASRNFSYVLETCWDPGVSYGVTPSCSADPTRQTFAGNWNGLLAAPLYTGTVGPLAFNVPAAFPPGLSTETQFNGVTYLAHLTVTLPDGSTKRAFKRILVSTRGTQNANPTLTGFTRDSVGLGALPTTTGGITPTVGVGAESYQAYSSGALSSFTEVLTVTWFLSEGAMSLDRTVTGTANTYTIPSPELYAQQLLIGVIRDGRGGVAWATLAR